MEKTPLLEDKRKFTEPSKDFTASFFHKSIEHHLGISNKTKQIKPQVVDDEYTKIPPIKTCLVFSCAAHASFTAYNGLQNVQSSINDIENLGVISMATIYASAVLVAPLLPSLLRIFGAKNLVAFCYTSMTAWTIVNFFQSFETFIPASLLVGLAQSLPMVVIGLYMLVISQSYLRRNSLPPERLHDLVSMFSGLYFFFHQFTQVSGNLISSLVLSQDSNLGNSTKPDVTVKCGTNMCPTSSSNSSDSSIIHPSQNAINLLLGIYLGCNVVGLVLLYFVPKLPHSTISAGPASTVGQEVKCFFTMFFNVKMMLMMPMMMGNGMLIMFIYSGFTKAYVSCTIGVQWVGFTLIAYGLSTSLFSIIGNSLARFLHRSVLILFFMTVDIAAMSLMSVWDPGHSPQKILLFVLPSVFGISMGISQGQINALLTTVFKDNISTGYIVYNAVKTTGYTTLFTVSSFACLYVRLYMIIAMYSLGVLCYIILELKERTEKNKKDSDNRYRTLIES